MRLFLIATLAVLATAVVPAPAAALVQVRDVGYQACLNVEPIVDTVVVTIGGAVPVGIVKTVVLSSGVNCIVASGGACPYFTATPAGPVYHRRAVGVGYFADCLAFVGPAYLGQQASVRVLGGSCHAYAGANVAGVGVSTPVVYWFCP